MKMYAGYVPIIKKNPIYYFTPLLCYIFFLVSLLHVFTRYTGRHDLSPSLYFLSLFGLSFFIHYALLILKSKVTALSILILSVLLSTYTALRLSEAWYLLVIPLNTAFYFFCTRIHLDQESLYVKLTNKIEDINTRRLALKGEYFKKRDHIEGTEKRLGRYLELTNMMAALNSALSVHDISSIIIDKTFELVEQSNRVVMYLIDSKRQNIFSINYKKRNFKVRYGATKGDIFDYWVLKNEKPLSVQNAKDDFRFGTQEAQTIDGVSSAMVVPIISEAKLIGLLRVDHNEPNKFSQDDLRLVDIIASLSAVALQNAILYERMDELSKKDGLTSLYLRRFFEGELMRSIENAHQHKDDLSLLMIDIDFFKQYNDQFGHMAGDILLKGVSDIIRSELKKNDFACRYGGEEFVCVLKKKDKAAALKIAENIRKDIEARKFKLRRQNTNATVSIGVSCLDAGIKTAEELLDIADKELYRAKQSGRNQVCS